MLILLYLFPGSLIGCYLYDDCKLQPQITRDYIISSNHLYAFGVLSIIGFLTFKNSKKLKYLSDNNDKPKVDFRDFGIGAQILHDLGIYNINLLSNSKQKHRVGLSGYGLSIKDYTKY